MENQKEIDAFIADYKVLTEKHKKDFVNYPMFVPDGQGAFKLVVQTQVVDLTNNKPLIG